MEIFLAICRHLKKEDKLTKEQIEHLLNNWEKIKNY